MLCRCCVNPGSGQKEERAGAPHRCVRKVTRYTEKNRKKGNEKRNTTQGHSTQTVLRLRADARRIIPHRTAKTKHERTHKEKEKALSLRESSWLTRVVSLRESS